MCHSFALYNDGFVKKADGQPRSLRLLKIMRLWIRVKTNDYSEKFQPYKANLATHCITPQRVDCQGGKPGHFPLTKKDKRNNQIPPGAAGLACCR
jgi:hypothetical protein